MANVDEWTLGEFLHHINQKDKLNLNDRDIGVAVRTLEDQWFQKAAELRSLDRDACRLLNLNEDLTNSILRYFNADAAPALAPVYNPPASPVRASAALVSPRDELKKPQDESVDPRKADGGQNLSNVINHIVETAHNNKFVMNGLSSLLKKSIQDSNKGSMKNRTLREALKKVNQVGDAQPQSGALENEDEPEPEAEAEVGNADELKKAAPACGVCRGWKGKPKGLKDCSHSFCTECIHDYIMNLVGQKNAVGIKCPVKNCGKEVDVAVIQSILTPDEFNSYLEATLLAFIEHDNLTFQCPNDKCKAVIAMQPMKPQEVPNPITERDDDGKLLTAETWLHFQEFRFRCRECNTVFCASCKKVPYHKGYTCEQFRETQASLKSCRFCAAKLTDANMAKDVPGPGLKYVCTQSECLQKRDNCCTRVKECGCPCNGVRGEEEKDCLPCLTHETDQADEFCTICYVESLKDAPCIQLADAECGHIFHFHCVRSKLEARWPGARISFEFRNCPLCSRVMDHPSLAPTLAPILELQKVVEGKAVERLEYEGRANDPSVVNANGRFYNNPVGFALHNYLFYMCFQCKKPYFAGGYQCQEANAPFNPQELICPSCQPSSVDDCPKHGKDWLAYKCKYCCSFANWYCWGNSHFCGKCHVSGVWQKLSEFRTGKNKKKLWEYPQCPGLREQMDPIAMDNRLTEDQKNAKLSALLSDPLRCPLGVPHPPNGIEFGLGCSMCEDKKNEAINAELQEKAKRELEQKRLALSAVKNMLKSHPDGLELAYKEDMDENGLFYFLGTCGRTAQWNNPADAGFIVASSSGVMGDSVPVSALCGRELVRCVSKPVRNSWMMIDLVDLSLEPTHYTIRHYSSWDTECLRNWVLEASNDGVSWDALFVHQNDKAINRKGQPYTWQLDAQGRRYRMFRIIQTGPNSNNHFYLALSSMEFYGLLYDSVGGGDAEEAKGLEEKQQIVKSFNHQFDFDQNGIFYYLGTNCGKSEWQNPAMIGQVIVTASKLADRPPSMPASAIVGRSLVRCVTQAKPNMWFAVDLKDKKALVTHYTLKHYNSWDTECLRHWKLEASNDGVTWNTISNHRNDESLNGKGGTYTWKIENAEQKGSYSMFRLFQTGKNSNNHYYLACSGFEIYGNLYQTAPVQVGRGGLDLAYQYDFDSNGLFYWIGTRGKREPWRNPSETGLVIVSASNLATNPPSYPVHAITGRSLVRCVSAALPDQWFMVDLKDYLLQPTHYTLRHYISWDTEALRNWVLEASADAKQWKVIKEHKNDAALDKKGATASWPIPSNQGAFRYFRIRQTGFNSNNHHYLACSGMELYGRVFDATDQPQMYAEQKLDVQFADGTEFKYHHDFDENGIFYWLGTNMKTRPYRNPGETGLVKVISSPLASQSMPAWAACGRVVVRCVTEPKKNTFFTFDLGKVFVIPTAYTLRHYDSWDTEALRNWKLEGSIDGKKWKTLMSHKKDKALDAKGASATWAIKGVQKSYSMFKITQTGKNSNGHYYLSLSGFELYGIIYNFRKK